MLTLAQRLSTAGFADRLFNERQLGELLGGNDARRYGLVNRALKDGSLVRVKRGLYVLGPRYRGEPIHPFAVAQSLVPGSYISFESALAHHGWIPEAVFVSAGVTPGRKTLRFETPEFGPFSFHPLALRDYRFLTGVERVKTGKLTAFIAKPLRAVMDLAALRKERWAGLAWLTDGLRIDEALLLSLRSKEFADMKPVYKHKAANLFLAAFEDAVMTAKRQRNARANHD